MGKKTTSFFQRIYKIAGKSSPDSSKYFYMSVIFLGFLWYAVYTNFVIDRLNSYSKATTETYAQLISEALYNKTDNATEHIILERIIQDFDMPIIITDMFGKPDIWLNITVGHFFWKRKIDYNDNSYATRQILKLEMKKLQKEYKPKLIYGRNRKSKNGFLYYGGSSFIDSIALMPYFEALFVIVFALSIFFVVKAIRVTEKSNLWVGLAKETAHQLGTPLTSIIGWTALLKAECQDNEDMYGMFEDEFVGRVSTVVNDIEKDISRLQKVTNRFGMIGSLPSLVDGDIVQLLEEHLTYFSKRLPTLGKKIDLTFNNDNNIPNIKMNIDLLSWVFENLFKNSLDAIDKNIGNIEISLSYVEVDNIVRIIHKDSGKGVGWENRNSVFTPGYTTKKRGWGLGLTLARRIVTEYHQGKIFVSWSQKGKGTEFTIELPVES